LRVLDVPGAARAAAARQYAVPGRLRWRRLHDRQGALDPRARAVGDRQFPRRHRGRGPARAGDVGGPRPRGGPAQAAVGAVRRHSTRGATMTTARVAVLLAAILTLLTVPGAAQAPPIKI